MADLGSWTVETWEGMVRMQCRVEAKSHRDAAIQGTETADLRGGEGN